MNKKLIAMLFFMAPLALFAQKFGHLNSAEIMQLMPEVKIAEKKIQASQKGYEEELLRLQAEFAKNVEEYESKKSTMLESVRQRHEADLQDKQARLQESAQYYEQQLQMEYQQEMSLISEKITKAIKEVGVAGGYLYIFDVASGIPYISETLSTDVTGAVKAKLGIK